MSGKFPVYKQVDVDVLVPYARNSRIHSDEQIDKIAASIREFGFLNPIIIDGQNGIVAGHGRIMAAKKLGIKTVPAIEAGHLTDAQRRAYIIADNRLALDAGWDEEMLRIEFAELVDVGFSLDLTGFSPDEVADILHDGDTSKTVSQGDEFPEVFAVVVECRSEADQELLFNRLDSEGYRCRVQSL